MYAWFQKSWQGMKILTCESYLNALQNSTVSDNSGLKLTAQVKIDDFLKVHIC